MSAPAETAAPLSPAPSTTAVAGGIVVPVLGAVTAGHLLNDLVQSLMVASYPELRRALDLSYAELGAITLAYQATASVLQPVIGWSTDRTPRPWSLAAGMACTLIGLLVLSVAQDLPLLIGGACYVGIGSSVFHPEASRVARLASGGRYGLAQSVFQVGGNAGSALGPLCAALIVIPHGHGSLAWFAVAPLAGMVMLAAVGRWYRAHLHERRSRPAPAEAPSPLPSGRTALALAVLGALLVSKYVYLASLTNFLPFWLMERFGLTAQSAQWHLFAFLGATAAGTILGGPLGDRFGRRPVIWVSILGIAPFTLALPHAGLAATTALSVVIGLILASAFSAILVYAQELLPGRVGLVSGLFFGFAFGIAGIAAAGLGLAADAHGLATVYHACAWLPLLGVLTVFLPRIGAERRR